MRMRRTLLAVAAFLAAWLAAALPAQAQQCG